MYFYEIMYGILFKTRINSHTRARTERHASQEEEEEE